MIEPKDVTIIIPTILNGDLPLEKLDRQKYAFDHCLESLDETVPDIPKIIASNGGKPISYINYTQIHNWRQGQCMAVNAAVATTNTPWIFVTNDDMVYAPGWWDRLIRDITLDTKCISPKLVEPRPGALTFIVQPFGGAGGDFNKEGWLEFAKNYNGAEVRTGFNLPFLIRRELWDTIGGYDINYDPWGSNGDSDLEYKIKLAGVQPYQSQNSLVYHFSQTSGTFSPENQGYWQKNYAYFIEKWGFERVGSPEIWEATFNIPDEGRKFRPDWEGKYAG